MSKNVEIGRHTIVENKASLSSLKKCVFTAIVIIYYTR